MTGYGKATKTLDGREMTVELKSVNNRFLDINCKLPKTLVCVEDALRKEIQSVLSRGRVDVFVTYSTSTDAEKSVVADIGLAAGYLKAAKELEEKLGVTNDLTLTALMRIPEIVKPESVDEDYDTLEQLIRDTAKDALFAMNAMREKEGEKLKTDVLSRIETMRGYLEQIAERAPIVVKNYRDKLQARITDALNSVEIDEARLLNEVAFFTDKANIDEEITRLRSHFAQATDIMTKETLVGRKMDFLVQELNRETNTICSKSNDIEITNTALLMKSEIEKIREQIQNLE